MRVLLFTALATIGVVGSALAEPMPSVSTIEVSLSPELRKKGAETYGLRDVERLAADLHKNVEREMQRTGILAGGHLELVLVDAQPNRPTFKQLGDTPGLSYQSFGVGGASIEGRAISIDGEVTPVSYKWYETDIREAAYSTTWSDAQHAMQRFAHQLGRGEAYVRR